MKLVETFSSEFSYFWKSFIDNFVEWLLTICLGGSAVAISILIEPKQRIAFFDNFNERYPYSGETLGIPVLAIIIIILPCIVLGILILVFPRKFDLNLAYMGLAQSLCITLLITEALKVTVARPRPNFFSYCEYNETKKKCIGPDSHKRDARLSFPSGHASNAFASGVWFSLFLGDFTKNGEEVWWVLIRLIPIFIATFVAATRIIDYMHHVSDVISGVVIGTGISMVIYRAQANRVFMVNKKREEEFNPFTQL